MKTHSFALLATLIFLPALFAESNWHNAPVIDLFLDAPDQTEQFLASMPVSTDEALEIAQELSQEKIERRKEKKRCLREDKQKIIDTIAYACYTFIECIVSAVDEQKTRALASDVTHVLSSMIEALQVTDEFYKLKKNSPYTDKVLYQFYDEMLSQWEVLYETQEGVRAAVIGSSLQEYIALSQDEKTQWVHTVIDNAGEAMCLYEVFSSLYPMLPIDIVAPTLRSVTMELTMNTNRAPSAIQTFVYTNPIGRALRKVLTGNKLFSRLTGMYADTSLSRRHISGFIQKFDIDMGEAEFDVKKYRTFNQFFTRKLKAEARAIAPGSDVLTAPADGQVLSIDEISAHTVFGVKKHKFTLDKFLGDKKLAAQYEGGTMLIFRLAPWDYHRFHFPADGTPQKWKRIRGGYESVHPIAYASGTQPLTQNERHLIKMNTDEFDDMIMVPVGALCVGRIKETYKPHQRYAKGDEAGYFAFGGSTVVMLLRPGIVDVTQHIVQNSRRGNETAVKMGEAIGHRTKDND